MKKIIATWAAIAFAATLSSCELKKEEKTNEKVNTPVVDQQVNTPKVNTKVQWNQSSVQWTNINNAPEANTAPKLPTQPKQDPRMKLFQEKQNKMWKLFQEFEKNTPAFKPLQDQINAIFSSWKQPTKEDMKKVQELDWKIRALFTPEMKALDAELRQMWNELFWQPKSAPATPKSEPAPDNKVVPAEPTPESTPAEPAPAPKTWTWEQPMMILK